MSAIPPHSGSDQQTLRDVVRAVNGHLTLATISATGAMSGRGKNLDVEPVSLVISAANTDTAVGHNMLRRPMGWLVVGQTVGGSVYDGTSGFLGADWTTSSITLRATATGTYRLLLF